MLIHLKMKQEAKNMHGHVVSTLKEDVSTKETHSKHGDYEEIRQFSGNLQSYCQQHLSNITIISNRFNQFTLKRVQLPEINYFDNTLYDIFIKGKGLIRSYRYKKYKKYTNSSHFLVAHPSFKRYLQQNVIKKYVTATSFNSSHSVIDKYKNEETSIDFGLHVESKNKITEYPKIHLCENKETKLCYYIVHKGNEQTQQLHNDDFKKNPVTGKFMKDTTNLLKFTIPPKQGLLENVKSVFTPKYTLQMYRNSEVKSHYININHNTEEGTKSWDSSTYKSLFSEFLEPNMQKKILTVISGKQTLYVISYNFMVVKPACSGFIQYGLQLPTNLFKVHESSNSITVNQVQTQNVKFDVSNEFIASDIIIDNSLLISNSKRIYHNYINTFVNSSGFLVNNNIKQNDFEASLQSISVENDVHNFDRIGCKTDKNTINQHSFSESVAIKASNKLLRVTKYSELNSSVQCEMESLITLDDLTQESVIRNLSRLESDIKDSQYIAAHCFLTNSDYHSDDEFIDDQTFSFGSNSFLERVINEYESTQDKSILATPTTEDKYCQTNIPDIAHCCTCKRLLEFDDDLNIPKKSKVDYKINSGEKFVNIQPLTDNFEIDVSENIMNDIYNVPKVFSITNNPEHCVTLEGNSNFVTAKGIVPNIFEDVITTEGAYEKSFFDDGNELNWSAETTDEIMDISDQLVPTPRKECEFVLPPFPKVPIPSHVTSIKPTLRVGLSRTARLKPLHSKLTEISRFKN